MNRWEFFLASLATRGGNIFLLLLICSGLSGMVYHVLHHVETSPAVSSVILATFSNFTGALMMALTGSNSKQRNGDTNGKPPTPPTEVKP
jgi:hypothetical protein